MESAQSQQYRSHNNVSDIVLVSLLLTLNRFTSSSSVFIVNFQQVNACWDDNDNNDDNSNDKNVDRTDLTIDLILFLSLGPRAKESGSSVEGPRKPEIRYLRLYLHIAGQNTH